MSSKYKEGVIIKLRYKEYLKTKNINISNTKATLKKEGNYFIWSDLDCLDKDVANWQGMMYLNRTLNMLCKSEDEKEIEKLKSSFIYWLDNDFLNSNWWYNQIGVPIAVCDIVILLYERLTKEQLNKALTIIERGSLLKNEHINKWTGANLIWGIWTTAKHALIIEDNNLLKRAIGRASEEIVIAEGDKEGIKPDYSFFQHGPQHYTLGYGRSFTMSLALLVYILSGTDYQFRSDKLEILVRFLLEGQALMIRNTNADYLSIGREYCRINALSVDSIYESAILYSKTEGIPFKEKIEEFILKYEERRPFANCIKYFHNSLFLVNRNEDFYISVKGVNNKVTGTESLNRENLLGFNLSYGTNTCYMANGNEYNEMFALWDYSLLPGTTSFVENEVDLSKKLGVLANVKGKNETCGGYSIKNKGALYMDFVNLSITGTLAYIAYEKGMVVLCSGITCTDKENDKEIRTNINQCICEDNYVNDGNTVINGAFKYYNLCDKEFITSVGEKTRNMRRCNLSNPDINVTKPVFYLGLSHGTKPVDSSFAYCVTSKDRDPEILNIINAKSIQGVEFKDGTYVLVFHEPCEYVLSNGNKVKSDRGVIIDEFKSNDI